MVSFQGRGIESSLIDRGEAVCCVQKNDCSDCLTLCSSSYCARCSSPRARAGCNGSTPRSASGGYSNACWISLFCNTIHYVFSHRLGRGLSPSMCAMRMESFCWLFRGGGVRSVKRRVKVVPRPGREEALICIPVLLARWKAVRSPSPLPSSPLVPVRWMFCPYRPRLASIWGGYRCQSLESRAGGHGGYSAAQLGWRC